MELKSEIEQNNREMPQGESFLFWGKSRRKP